MKKNLLKTTAAFAVLLSLPALAATDSTTTPTVGERLDSGVAATQKAVAVSIEKIKDMMADKATDGTYTIVEVNLASSIAQMIGQDVHNAKAEKVSKVEDILINQAGNAAQIILTNGGFLGMGARLVAVDYGLVYMRTDNGDVIMPVTDEIIKNMVPFSYDTAEAKNGMRTVPAGYLSAKAMLDGHLLDARGQEVGAIDNVTLPGGRAGKVIVGYNTTMGMGGDKIAISYDLLEKTTRGTKVDFKMTEGMATRFTFFTTVTK